MLIVEMRILMSVMVVVGGGAFMDSWKYEDQNSCHPDEAIGEQPDSD